MILLHIPELLEISHIYPIYIYIHHDPTYPIEIHKTLLYHTTPI